MLGKKVADFTAAATGGTFRLSAHKGHPVVLYFYPEGQHAGLHDRGRRLPRPAQAVREARRRGRRRVARQPEVARELQGEDGLSVRADLRCRRDALHAVRRHQDEEHVRQEGARHRAQHVPHRRRRQLVARVAQVKVPGHAAEVLERRVKAL